MEPILSRSDFPLDGTLGALEVSVLFCYGFTGILTLQVFIYFRNFRDDSWKLKLLVITTWILDIIQCALLASALYTATITDFGNPFKLLFTPWTLVAASIMNALIGAISQSYATLRIWLIAGYLPVCLICWISAVIRMTGLIVLAGITINLGSLTATIMRWRWLLITTMSLGAMVDVVIALALCLSLYRKQCGFEAISRVVDKISMVAIETGLLSSLLSISIPITFAYSDSTYTWMALYLITAKVFSNSLMASLNLREIYRKELKSRSSAIARYPRPRRTFPFIEPNRVEIEMTHTTVTIHDGKHPTEVLDLKSNRLSNGPGQLKFPPRAARTCSGISSTVDDDIISV